MMATRKKEIVKFRPNVPVEVALKFATAGTIVSTRFGERVMYTLADDRVMFLDLGVAQKVNELGVNVRETFSICKPSGAKNGAGWTVWLSAENAKSRNSAAPSDRQSASTAPLLSAETEEAVETTESFHSAKSGVFDLEAESSVAPPTSLTTGAEERDVRTRLGQSNKLKQRLFNASERGTKTMELNGHAAAGALTPATAEVVTNDHSNTAEITRKQDPARAELSITAQEISRFMPVMAIEQALQRRQTIVDATQKLMRPGVDFGKVPGSDRDVLLQPGADKLCNLFGLVIHYEVAKSEEDWTGERHGGSPFFFYEVRGRAYRGDFLMGEGVGSCSSWETKYRWRRAERICPQCGKANIRKSHRETGWYCWTKTDGCGAQFEAGDPAIESQESGRKENPDVADLVNTVLKMAYKRCKVSTTINATSASEFFTQDVDEQRVLSTEHDSRSRNGSTGDANNRAASAERGRERNATESRGPSAHAETTRKMWANRGEMKRMFDAVREQVGEAVYLSELGRFSVRKPEEFRNESAAWSCFNRLADLAKEVA